jgi:hypothetical protein
MREMDSFALRLSICESCPEFISSGTGRCKDLRDSFGRAGEDLLQMRLNSGVCPRGRFDEVNRKVSEENRTKNRRQS